MAANNRQVESPPVLGESDAFERLSAGNTNAMFGVCSSSGTPILTWLNASARRGLPTLTCDGDIGLDAALDAFQVDEATRSGARLAIETVTSYRSLSKNCSDANAHATGSVEVIPDHLAGQGQFAVIVRRPSPAPQSRCNPLDTRTTPDTMDLLVRALDALSAEVALLDGTGQIVAVNRAWRDFARLNGFECADAGVGTNYLAICDGAQGTAEAEAHTIASGLRAVLAGQQSATYVEYPCDSPDEQRWFQVRASGFDWEGHRYAVVSHESLIESKRAEQRHREQLDEMAHQWQKSSLGELASGIAHELNQPLGAITNYMNGCLRRLENGTIDREQLIKTARECAELAEFAGGIIKRMRGFASHTKCQYQPMSFNDAIAKALQFFKAGPESGKVRLSVELAPDLPHVRADEVQIQQVALNLVRNAGDSVRECGCAPARVQITTFLDDEGMVCLAVADNGQGLPDGAEGRLFEPFFSTKSKGMGLGLSISKTIAEVHGGRLIARNAPGGGAVFELRLPSLKRSAGLCDKSAANRSEPIAPNNIRSKNQGGAR